MATPTEWRNEFQVNTGGAATGGQFDPKIVGLANGGFVVIWVESTDGTIATSSGTDIVAKIYDAEGNVVRDSYQLNNSWFADDERDIDVTATHDGFAIAYIDDSIASVNGTGVRYDRFNLAGNQVQSLAIADENVVDDFLTNPQIAANLIAANDDIYVAYDDDVGADTDISARVIDENGTLGVEFGSAQNSNDRDALGDVAVLTNGNFVTVYTEVDGTTTGIEFVLRTPAGLAGANVQVSAAGTDPAVTSLAGGGFVVVYGNANDVFMRIYSDTGTAVTAALPVATGANNQNEAVVVGLQDGGYVVAWDDDSSDNLFARRFNADGTADGSTFSVENVNITNIDISVTGDGRILFAWTDLTTGEISASIWDPRAYVINPDDYNVITENFLSSDVIVTNVTGSQVNAGAKGDTVLGQQGNDRIYSSGDGTFRGGAGNDTIYADDSTTFADFELLDGGAGTADWVVTTSFSGNYGVNLVTGVTTVNGAVFAPESFINFENISTGIGNDNIVGTAGANYIITSNGNDTITSGAGNDTIISGIGNDSINASGGGTNNVFGGDGDDVIRSSGAGTYRGEAGDDTLYTGVGLSETLDGGAGIDTLITTASVVDYAINLVTGVTNFPPESFINFENITTGIGNDTITGTSGANIINTGSGNDSVLAGAGNDTINTGAGDDVVVASSGSDVINGGSGNDTLTSSGTDTIFGDSGNDSIFAGLGLPESLDGGTGIDTLNTTLFTGSYVVNLATGLTNFGGETFLNFENIVSGVGSDELFGTVGANRMEGGGGNDRILGFAGNDTLLGDLGDDTLNGGDGNDSILGGDGNDSVFAEAGNDTLDGGAGNDLLEGKIGDDSIVGGIGDDTLRGSDGNDSIQGGEGNDVAFGGNDNDSIFGDEGNDTLDGSSGDDTIDGWDGDDVIVGETGNDNLLGYNGDDTMRGGGGNDTMFGEDDDDLMFGSSGEDLMRGGNGNDTLEGDTQSDDLFGDAGNDVLRGGDGFDFLDGGFGDDTLAGGNGNDTLLGNSGQDILRGNAQNDTFDFNFESDSTFAASDLIDGIDGIGVAGGDIIDLAGIDANTTIAGNQAFTFLGAVSSAVGIGFGAGGLWVENAGGQTRLYGNTDNDGVIEFAVRIVDGGITANDYIAGDFIL